MFLNDDDTSNLRELTPINSKQHVTITTVDSSVNVSLKTLIEQQAAMSSNNEKLQILTNLTSILKHNVNAEQTSKGSSSTSSQEQSLVLKTRHKEILMIQMAIIGPLIKALGSTPITGVCSHQQHYHIEIRIK